jgi:hypothetical protein
MSPPKMAVTVNVAGLPVVEVLVRILKAALAELPANRRAVYLRDIDVALAAAQDSGGAARQRRDPE